MPDLYKFIEGKKFMWDGEAYESESEALEKKKEYEADRFEVRLITEEAKPFLFTRRVVTEVKVEGEPPPS